MSPKRLTVDDLRHHAEEVRDLAVSETREFADQQATKVAVIGAVAIVAAISIAYYIGTRASGRDF